MSGIHQTMGLVGQRRLVLQSWPTKSCSRTRGLPRRPGQELPHSNADAGDRSSRHTQASSSWCRHCQRAAAAAAAVSLITFPISDKKHTRARGAAARSPRRNADTRRHRWHNTLVPRRLLAYNHLEETRSIACHDRPRTRPGIGFGVEPGPVVPARVSPRLRNLTFLSPSMVAEEMPWTGVARPLVDDYRVEWMIAQGYVVDSVKPTMHACRLLLSVMKIPLCYWLGGGRELRARRTEFQKNGRTVMTCLVVIAKPSITCDE